MSYLHDRTIFTRYICAGNPHTPMIILERLAREGCASVRRRIGENPRTPNRILIALVDDPDPEVRQAIADNPDMPFGILQILADDESADVRYALAENHGVPLEILVKLATDENPYVANRAISTLKRLDTKSLVTLPVSAPEVSKQSALS